jgi:probable addiction module antidote protein
MNQTIKISELPLFDAVDYLKTDIDMAQYLAAVREDGDPALLLAAIKDITKAKKIRGTNKIDGA